MTYDGRSAETRQSREKPSTKPTPPGRDRPIQAHERNTHPIHALQKSVGNRAVQRALGHQPQATHLQRHIAPGTAALGRMLSASLLGHFAARALQSLNLQQITSETYATADGLPNDIAGFSLYSVSAETYDAESAAQTTPSTLDITEPLVIHGSDSQPAQ